MAKFIPPHCPNPDCEAFCNPPENWFGYIGFYRAQCRPEPVQRCRCKLCCKSFSSQTFRFDYRDRKPWTNEPLFELLTSGVGLQGSVKVVVHPIGLIALEHRSPS